MRNILDQYGVRKITYLSSLSAKQTLFDINKFIFNENKYGITDLGIGRKRTINIYTLRENTFPPLFSTLSFTPNSCFLLIIAIHYTHFLQWGNAPCKAEEVCECVCVCVCKSYGQYIVVFSSHSLLFIFYAPLRFFAPLQQRKVPEFGLRSLDLFFFFLENMSYSMCILRIPAWYFCDKNQQDVAHIGVSYF